MDPELLLRLFDETTALFHRLRAAAAQAHGQGELTAARRGILLSLEQHGPSTVPALARMRPVSRQHVQSVVDGLLADGLVQTRPNSAHRRSNLIALTAGGQALLGRIHSRERKLLAGIAWKVTPRSVKAAASVLRQVRIQLEDLREA